MMEGESMQITASSCKGSVPILYLQEILVVLKLDFKFSGILLKFKVQ